MPSFETNKWKGMVPKKLEKLKIGHKKQKLVIKHNLIDLTLKDGGLFVCLLCWAFANHGFHIFGVIGKPLMNRGAWNWSHNVLTYGWKTIKYWIVFPLKIHLNQN